MIGIIGAMDEEVAKLKTDIENVEVTSIAGMEFNKGIMFGKEVVVVCSGIGKVNAAICAQILCDKYNATTIINTGIAGSLNNDINIGDIVLSVEALQHDFDVTGFGYELGVIPRMETSVFKGDKKLIELAKNIVKEKINNINIFEGRIVSGDQFISSHEKKEYLVNTFKGDCTEMEGAAIAQAAVLNKVPFLIVRAISDKADDSAATMDYPTFEAMAIENSVTLLKTMVERL